MDMELVTIEHAHYIHLAPVKVISTQCRYTGDQTLQYLHLIIPTLERNISK